jgi:hypothetical protein
MLKYHPYNIKSEASEAVRNLLWSHMNKVNVAILYAQFVTFINTKLVLWENVTSKPEKHSSFKDSFVKNDCSFHHNSTML